MTIMRGLPAGSFDYDDPRDYEEWCNWNDVDVEEGYYDPFQLDVSPGTAFGRDSDTVVVASVVCEAMNVDLQISELPGPYGDIGSGPGTPFPEPGDMLDVPDLWNFFDVGPKGPSPVSGDMSDPPVPASIYISLPFQKNTTVRPHTHE